MKWSFPLINPGTHSSVKDLINKVLSELNEFDNENDLEKKGMEAIDILHSAETLVRKFFSQNPSLSFPEMKKKVIKKNNDRGYYLVH